ncbi:MAG TPA: alpha/beta fold hydrolase [Solirubrobacterales bacterium]|nr:alpha/beta fold hydrolase [Solirubrobacterales bacterium]
MRRAVAEAIERHRSAGREFEAAGIESFVLEQGDGEPVVLMHGIPVSSFLYRKVVPLLAERGLRGVAFDLPGLGLAAKPPGFDYSWSGLGRWTGEAIDALGLDRCHLVLHDIGGPIGLEWALPNPDRVRTLTVLDTLIDVAHFRRVWTMDLAAPPVIGPVWVATIRPPLARWLFYLQGIGDRSATPAHEVDAHIALLHRNGGGSSFRKIVRGFELTEEKEALYVDGLRDAGWPATILWGDRDPALGEDRRRVFEEVLGIDAKVISAKHFLQEDQARAVADAIAGLAGST